MAREELNINELEEVAGGRLYINPDTKKAVFSSTKKVVQLTGDLAEIKTGLKELEGKYKTQDEYDTACMQMLVKNNWVQSAKI